MKMLVKSKFGQGIIVIGILAGAMVATNPGREAYVNYAAVKLVQEVKSSVCQSPEVSEKLGEWQDIFQDLADGFSGICKGAVATGGTVGVDVVKNIIDQNTIRQNFLVASVYETKIPDKTFKTLGIFGNLFTFSAQ